MAEPNKYAKAANELIDTEGGRRVVGVPMPPVVPSETVGTGGTAVWGGYLQELEKDKSLTGVKKYETYSDLLANVATIATGVRFYLNLVSKAVWKVEPAEDQEDGTSSQAAQDAADLTWEILNDMETPWHRVVRRASMYKYYGFSIQEWTAKMRDDGNVGFLDIEPRAQITIERWDLDIHSRVLGAVQRSPQTQLEIYLPREKIVYLVDDSLNDSPEGLGLFRNMVDAGRRLRRYLQLEGFGYEGDLRGIPLARAPLSDLDQLVKDKKITKQRADELVAAMRKFLENHIKSPQLAMMLDSKTYQTTDDKATPSSVPQWDVTLLDGGTYSLAEVHEAIKRIMNELARLMGIDHLMLGDGDAGSFALAKEKSQNFFLIVDNALKEIAEQFEKDILDPLWELNGWPEETKPSLKFESLAKRDVAELTAALRDLATTGVTLDRNDEAVQEIFDALGLTRLEVNEMLDSMMQLGIGLPPEGAPPQPEALGAVESATERAAATTEAEAEDMEEDLEDDEERREEEST